MMGLAIAQLSCFALLTAAALAECSVNHGTPNESAHKLPLLRHAKDDIFAGEDTPVWLARRQYPHNTIVYERLTYEGIKAPTIVKQSLNYWDSIKRNKGFRVRRKPKIDQNYSEIWERSNLPLSMISELRMSRIFKMSSLMEQTYIKPFNVRRESGNDSLISSSRINKEHIVEEEVLYPSVLVVVDYHDVHPEAERRVRWLMKEKIIYALSFWSTVDRSLRQIRNPRVSLRIAGIVISLTRGSSPYLKENQGKKTLVNALPKMLRYWKKVAKENSDFRIGSYDIIAHMTDIHPRAKCKKCAAPHQQKPAAFCVASKGPPCKLPNKVAGFIIHDDFAFKGLHLATSWMPKVFGSSVSPKVYHRRKWTKEMLDPISTALKDASCMSAPKGRYPPAKRVAPILAGELFPGVKQCEAAGYRKDAWTCWHTKVSNQRSNCQYLACSDRHNRHDYCSEIGRTLDGTFCDEKNTMICLDGDCVKKNE